MDDENKKSEEEKSEDESKSSRGRPKKSPSPDLVSEPRERLEMEDHSETPVTIKQIQKDLTQFYAKYVGSGSSNSYWMGTSIDLNTWNPFM